MRGEVAERSGARGVPLEAPDGGVRVAPVLQITTAEVTELAELAGLDHLPGEAHRRDEAIVERTHVLHPGGGDAAPDLVALVRVASERLLADDVLARLGRGDRRRGMERVGPEIVEELDLGIGHELFPVAGPANEAVPSGRLGDCLGVSAGDRDEPRLERRRPRHVRDLAERVRMGLAHERVAEHPDADLCTPVP